MARVKQHDDSDTPRPPHELWAQADKEHPNDPDKRRMRYIELMVEAEHLIIEPPEQEQYTLDDPPPWINKGRWSCWRRED